MIIHTYVITPKNIGANAKLNQQHSSPWNLICYVSNYETNNTLSNTEFQSNRILLCEQHTSRQAKRKGIV